ncbi:MAG: ribonuclease Z [Candidatus Diapherotrites archaeon]
MSIEMIFLGTSCSTPTTERNLSSMALLFRGNQLLFDTPEGVQQQMMRTGLSYLKVEHIFISHFHADHILGLPGLVATMSIHERKKDLHIYGPRGIEEKIKQAVALANALPTFRIIPHEIKEGVLLKHHEYTIHALELNHSSKCYGFVFEANGKEGEFQRTKAIKLGIPEGTLWGKLQRGETITHNKKKITPAQVMDYTKALRGGKIAYITDTFPHTHYIDQLKKMKIDVLIHESSFMENEKERAEEVKHSTARMAGEIAQRIGAAQLFLTHFSPRYANGKEMVKEARKEFTNVVGAHDLLRVETPERYPITAKTRTKK